MLSVLKGASGLLQFINVEENPVPLNDELLKGLGVEEVFDYGKPGWAAQALEVTRPHGVQVFLDSTGDLATEAFSLLGQFGRWIVYGARSGKQNIPRRALANDREEHFSHGLQPRGQSRSGAGRTQRAFQIRDRRKRQS